MRHIVFFVNRVAEITHRQTTALLIASFIRRGYRVTVAEIDGLSIQSAASELMFRVRGLVCPMDCETSESIEQVAQKRSTFSHAEIDPKTLVMIRTNPGRDIERRELHLSLIHI